MKKDKVEVTGDVRVRYAPSPTGFLHLGNAQSALFNYLFAKHYNGTWVLRIEDTDLLRNVPHGEESQMENLHWLGIDWDEGPDKPKVEFAPYHQKDRVDLYHKYVQQLLDAGFAYRDYTTEEELKDLHEQQLAAKIAPHYDGRWYGATKEQIEQAQAEGRKSTVRLHLPEDHVYGWDDMIKGRVEFNSDNIGGDFIIEKSNGMATYNFAVVIDDYLMKMTHVLRGDDHIANTPKQIAVYEALGIPQPLFGHITLIYSLDTHKKLSKRDKNTLQFISQYRKYGYLSEALLNFIAFLGWSPVGEKELFTKEELIEAYDINRMSASPAYFDQKKLDWTNAEYIKKLSVEELATRVLSLVDAAETEVAQQLKAINIGNEIEFVKKVIDIYHTEAKTLMTFMEKILFIKQADQVHFTYDDLAEFDSESVKQILNVMDKELKDTTDIIDYPAILTTIQKLTSQKGRKLYMPLNVIFTDSKSAPQIVDILSVMPKKTVQLLVNNALKFLNN
ncbi:glutamate--tRNA ligase [Enterococcus hermanniensis]|uniref:Glutamate--tRNA ligase n=1 Tax=Enterococcus hermanniensis TaxID=249189 RepID=A0A1L8TMU2_9ENTE|nr:glutamate--tRNA ligase [Enterococcus hermanniensis]OJG45442.1 glutamate-tRNA ligase [Enterococcus hermanniensis]